MIDPYRGKVAEDPGRFREAEDNCSLISTLVLPFANEKRNDAKQQEQKLIRIFF